MKAFVQRTIGKCSIEIEKNGKKSDHGFSGVGLVVLLGWLESDLANPKLEEAEDWILSRVLGLRVFEDKDAKMNLNLADYAQHNKLSSGIFWVSQFTLAAELDSGFRPSFIRAMNPLAAQTRYMQFCNKIEKNSPHQNYMGVFGANMKLSFTNWGPVSIMLEK